MGITEEKQSLWENLPELEKERNILASPLLLLVFLIYLFIFHCLHSFLAWASESRKWSWQESASFHIDRARERQGMNGFESKEANDQHTKALVQYVMLSFG